MAVLSMSMVDANSAGGGVYMMSLLASMVLGMFVLPRTANSGAGLGVIFLVTGLLGFGVGPVVGMYMSAVNGPQVVATALAAPQQSSLGCLPTRYLANGISALWAVLRWSVCLLSLAQ